MAISDYIYHIQHITAIRPYIHHIRPLAPTCAGKAMRKACERVKVDVRRDWRLAQHRLEDLAATAIIGQWDVDQLVQATGAQQRWIDDVRPGGGTGARERRPRGGKGGREGGGRD